MAKIVDLLFKDNYVPGKDIMAEYGNLNKIRNQIIDSIYLFSGIFGTFAMYGTVTRIMRFGWQPFFVFNFILYVSVWILYLFRNKILLQWKASVFFLFFFILASSINYTNGVISGAMMFVFITTLATLIFGWKVGVISIILTLVVRTSIGWCFYKGILQYSIDLTAYANSLAAMITGIMGGLVVALITVFAINKFYKWLIITLKTVSVKVNELEQMNTELLESKQKAEEHDRLKSVFLANMSHEIRTPMNAIVGFSELLSKPNLSDEQKLRFISLVQERSYDLMRIIEDILDISKLEVNQMNLIQVEFEIQPMLLEIYEYYKLRMEKLPNANQLEFTCIIPENLKQASLFLDNQRLKQVLTNLLDNAFKFTMKGKIEFGCNLKPNSDLLFWVKDTGIGILQSKQFVIFDRFRQADDSIASRQYGGTGLGLSIVQGIIKLMNGKIWLESEVGKGSTFFFTIPDVRPIQKTVTINQDFEISPLLWKDKTILIVEDDFANSEYLREVFADTQATVFLAHSGAEAFQMVKDNTQIDIILMDIRLPDTNGLILTEKIKKEFPKIKVIAQTAYAGSKDVKSCLESGCDDFIAKPIHQVQLFPLINKYLADKNKVG